MAVQQVQAEAGTRLAWWRRLSPASFGLAALTARHAVVVIPLMTPLSPRLTPGRTGAAISG